MPFEKKGKWADGEKTFKACLRTLMKDNLRGYGKQRLKPYIRALNAGRKRDRAYAPCTSDLCMPKEDFVWD
jgi:hypothetical protein